VTEAHHSRRSTRQRSSQKCLKTLKYCTFLSVHRNLDSAMIIGVRETFMDDISTAKVRSAKDKILAPQQVPVSSPVLEKTPNNQYTVYMHQCQSADYDTPEFNSLVDARTAIAGALNKNGFSSVKVGKAMEHCDILGLTVIASYEKDEDKAKEAASAIDEILSKNRKASERWKKIMMTSQMILAFGS
jgi:hypothetical protein